MKLHFAINKENYLETQMEVEREIDNINYVVHGNTPLFLAVLRQNIKIVQLLLESGADVNKTEKTKLQRQPIHAATKLGNLELVKLLIQYGANLNSVDMDDMTPLSYAAYIGRTDIVKFLCDMGAHIETKDGRGKTPLFNAVENNSLETVELLCSLGALVNTHDSDGWTPLIHCVVCGFFDLAEYILSAGANIHDTDRNGETVLHFACARLSSSYITCLSKSNIDFYKRPLETATPAIHLAMNSTVDEVALLDLLIDYGSDVNSLSGFDETPLEKACLENKFHLVEFLVHAGATFHQQQWVIDKIIQNQNLCYLLSFCEVRSLQDQCKFSIRKFLGRPQQSIRRATKKLPLPDRLLEFLQLHTGSQ